MINQLHYAFYVHDMDSGFIFHEGIPNIGSCGHTITSSPCPLPLSLRPCCEFVVPHEGAYDGN